MSRNNLYKAHINISYRPHMPLYDLLGDLHYEVTFQLAPMDVLHVQIVTKEIAKPTQDEAREEAQELARKLQLHLGPDYTVTVGNINLLHEG